MGFYRADLTFRGLGRPQQLLRLPALHHLSLLPPPLHPSSLATQYPATAIPRFHLPHPIPQFLRTLEISRLSPMGVSRVRTSSGRPNASTR